MALSNYAELQTAIADWLNRSDMTAVIPDFITLAEAFIRREVFTMGEEISAPIDTVIDQGYVDLPNDFNALIGVNYNIMGKDVSLSQVDQHTIRRDYGGVSGYPVVYSVADDKLLLAPTPSGVYSLNVNYYQFLDLATNSTNNILTKFPDLYLRMSLLEAARYLSDRESVAYWDQLAQLSLQSVREYAENNRMGGNSIIRNSYVY